MKTAFSGGPVKSYVSWCSVMLLLSGLGAASALGAPVNGPAKTPETAAMSCPADDGPALPEVRTAAADQAAQESLVQRANILFSLVETRHPDGSVSVDLEDVFRSQVVMQRNPDGSMTIRCFPAGARVVFPLPLVRQPLEER